MSIYRGSALLRPRPQPFDLVCTKLHETYHHKLSHRGSVMFSYLPFSPSHRGDGESHSKRGSSGIII